MKVLKLNFSEIESNGNEELIGEILSTFPSIRASGYNCFTGPMKYFEGLLDSFDWLDIELYGEGIPKRILNYIDAKNALIEKANTDTNDSFDFKTKPFDHQLECFEYAKTHDSFLLGDEPGLGKALALDTKVYTPSGYKLMADIEVGDYVMSVDGKPTKVTQVYNHENLVMYKMTFSDGSSIKCCEDHLWEIYSDNSKPKVVDTKWFVGTNHYGKKRNLEWKGDFHYRIPKTAPVEFNSVEVDVDPYILGVLLGDGSLTGGGVSLSNSSEFIINSVRERLPNNHVIHQPPSLAGTIEWLIRGYNGVNEITLGLRKYQLMGTNSHTKFIPDEYKYNDVSTRTALLTGLLNTDGYAAPDNSISYTTVSTQLRDDVIFLVQSLGGLCSTTTYTDKEGRVSYTITIRFDDPTKYVTLPYRLARLAPRKFKPRRNIVSVEQIESAPGKCITVDHPSALYLIENFIVTHNTKMSIDIAVSRKKQFKHCLVVCCVSGLKWNWAEEIKVHSNESSHVLGSRVNKNGNLVIDSVKKRTEDLLANHEEFFLITNIETLRDKVFCESLKELTRLGEIGMTIVDEVHKCKNPSSQQGASLLKLQSYYKLALTGTPIMNAPIDLYNVLNWLGVEHHTLTEFKAHYCIIDSMGTILGYKNLTKLKDLLAENMLRRTKKDVLNLPEKIRIQEYVDMDSTQSKIYREAKEKVIEDIDKVKLSNNPLAEFIRMRQATGNPSILTSKKTANAKFTRANELIEESIANGKNVVVFSTFERVITPFYEQLNVPSELIIGELSEEEKHNRKERFLTDDSVRVVCGTTKVLGTGFTLTKASVAIFLDSPWTEADKIQAEDRIHRISTKEDVLIYTLVAKNTIDEAIEELVKGKGELSDYLVDGKINSKFSVSLFDMLLK